VAHFEFSPDSLFPTVAFFWQPHWVLPKIGLSREAWRKIALVGRGQCRWKQSCSVQPSSESKVNDELRFSQVEEVLSDAAAAKARVSVMVAGDFNLDASKD